MTPAPYEGLKPAENAYTNLEKLVGRAIYAENLFNSADISDEEKSQELGEICEELTADCTYKDVRVELSGTLISPIFKEDNTVNSVQLAEASASEEGLLKGFGVVKVPILIEDFPMGNYHYICHMVYTGSSEKELPDGNVEQCHFRTFFPVRSSGVTFLEDGYAHDLNKLRESSNRIVETIDLIAYDENLTLYQKLRRLDDLFGLKLPAMSESEARSNVSYLNSLGLISNGFQPVLAEYAVITDVAGEKIVLLGTSTCPVVNVMGLEITNRYRVKGLSAIGRTEGLGIAGKTYQSENQLETRWVFPLNQELAIEDPSEAGE